MRRNGGQAGKGHSCRGSHYSAQRLAEGQRTKKLFTTLSPAWPAGVNHVHGKPVNTTKPNIPPSDPNSHGNHQKIIIKLTASTTGSFSLFKGVLESLFVEGD